MKALVSHGPNQPFSLETVDDPKPNKGEAVAKVLACGAGLTVQHVKAGRTPIPFPRIMGHEIAAEIVEVNGECGDLTVGMPVTAYFYLTCGYYKWCLTNRQTLCKNFGGYVGRACDGGYAEYIKLPAKNFIPIPKKLDIYKNPAEIGVICDAIATPYKVLRRGRIAPLERVAVFGAGGGLGIQMLKMVRWANCHSTAVEIDTSKFKACLKHGADICIDANSNDAHEALIDASDGGYDVVIDFVSSTKSLEMGVEILGRGGRLITLGGGGGSSSEFKLNGMSLLSKEIEVMGSRYCSFQEVIESLQLVAEQAHKGLMPLVTRTSGFEGLEDIHNDVEHSRITGRAALVL